MSSTFCQRSLAREPRKRSRAPCAYQASAPSSSNASMMRIVHIRIVEDVDRAIGLLVDEHRDRHAPGALARDHPIGACCDHSANAVLTLRRHPACRTNRFVRTLTQREALPGRKFDRRIHRNEPLRRVAVDHGLLGAPGMRILMSEPTSRDQHAGINQRVDHRLVGVAFFAFFSQYTLAGEARRLLGETTVSIDGVRNGGIDAALSQLPRELRSIRRSPRGHGPAQCGRSLCRYPR